MKSVFILCVIAASVASLQAFLIGKRDVVSECYSCDWTADLDSCTGTETCGSNMQCADRYRLGTAAGVIQVTKGCRDINWISGQPQCQVSGGATVVGESCVIPCDGELCNNDNPTLVKGLTERYCKQCDWDDSTNCASSCSCPMSEAACATQVKYADSSLQYKFKCVQKHYCQNQFTATNDDAVCGSTPADASGIPDGDVCNYCATGADNSNP